MAPAQLASSFLGLRLLGFSAAGSIRLESSYRFSVVLSFIPVSLYKAFGVILLLSPFATLFDLNRSFSYFLLALDGYVFN